MFGENQTHRFSGNSSYPACDKWMEGWGAEVHEQPGPGHLWGRCAQSQSLQAALSILNVKMQDSVVRRRLNKSGSVLKDGQEKNDTQAQARLTKLHLSKPWTEEATEEFLNLNWNINEVRTLTQRWAIPVLEGPCPGGPLSWRAPVLEGPSPGGPLSCTS